MAQVTSHDQGNFCWCELVTSDQAAAKAFYTDLFGWTADDQEMGPGQFYTMLQLNGKNVGALYGMDDAQKARKVPPHWNLYVAVASVDNATAKAESLGGKVMMPPFDVMDVGRMSAIQDPAGAMIMLWEAKLHTGAAVIDEPGAFCWYELLVNDIDAAKAFYTGLFGWTAGGSPEYIEWVNGEKHFGGMMKIQPEWGPMPPNWKAYVMVKDCDATTAKATSLGATTIMEPMDIGSMGRFSVIQDPQGAVIAIYQNYPAA